MTLTINPRKYPLVNNPLCKLQLREDFITLSLILSLRPQKYICYQMQKINRIQKEDVNVKKYHNHLNRESYQNEKK